MTWRTQNIGGNGCGDETRRTVFSLKSTYVCFAMLGLEVVLFLSFVFLATLAVVLLIAGFMSKGWLQQQISDKIRLIPFSTKLV